MFTNFNNPSLKPILKLFSKIKLEQFQSKLYHFSKPIQIRENNKPISPARRRISASCLRPPAAWRLSPSCWPRRSGPSSTWAALFLLFSHRRPASGRPSLFRTESSRLFFELLILISNFRKICLSVQFLKDFFQMYSSSNIP